MNIALPARLDFDEFLAWAALQEEGKYELIDGVPIQERHWTWSHSKTRMQIVLALRGAIEARSSPLFVAPNGPAIRVSNNTVFVPDASVAYFPEPPPDSLTITNPVIVVEVLSPSTAKLDATTKLAGYFEVPSVQHYLVVDAEGQTIKHHKRAVGDVLETCIVSAGTLRLDPPGIELDLARVFPASTAGNA
jgi:Uma2 family endonuclease